MNNAKSSLLRQNPLQQVQNKVTPYEAYLPLLLQSERILLAFPLAYTPDYLAAAVALAQVLKSVGKSVTLASPGGEGYGHGWLAGDLPIETTLLNAGEFIIRVSTTAAFVDRVQYTTSDDTIDLILTPKDGKITPGDVTFPVENGSFDVIVTLGAQTREDLGTLWTDYPAVWAETPIIALNASLQSPKFTSEVLLDPRASTLSEMVLRLISQSDVLLAGLTPELATVLLSGVIGASSSFLEPNTKPGAFRAAAELYSRGADHTKVIDKLFKSKPLRVLNLWGAALRSLHLDRLHKVTWGRITALHYADAGATSLDIRGMSDQLLRHVKEAEISVLFIEEGNNTRIEVRSTGQEHLFEGLHFGEGYTVTPVPHGVDIFVPDQSAGEVELEFLRDLMAFQKDRHNLPADLPITKVNVIQEGTEEKKTALKKRRTATKKAWNTDNVPFVAPIKKEST